MRGLPHLRQILSSLGVTVLGAQVAVARAHEAFDERGALRDPALQRSVDALARAVVEMAGRLKAADAAPRIHQDKA